MASRHCAASFERFPPTERAATQHFTTRARDVSNDLQRQKGAAERPCPPVRFWHVFKVFQRTPPRINTPINIDRFRDSVVSRAFTECRPTPRFCYPGVTPKMPGRFRRFCTRFQSTPNVARHPINIERFRGFVVSTVFADCRPTPRFCYHCVTTETPFRGRIGAPECRSKGR